MTGTRFNVVEFTEKKNYLQRGDNIPSRQVKRGNQLITSIDMQGEGRDGYGGT